MDFQLINECLDCVVYRLQQQEKSQLKSVVLNIYKFQQNFPPYTSP